MRLRSLDSIKRIVVHRSKSEFGDVQHLAKWHIVERGFDYIGYHYLILNGELGDGVHNDDYDGVIRECRPIEYVGSHAKGSNSDSVGICLVGVADFTIKQFESLRRLIWRLMDEILSIDSVLGHCEVSGGVTMDGCPNFDMDEFRKTLTLFQPSRIT